MSSYKRTFWKNSPETEITAEKLNNMEEGIEKLYNNISNPNLLINGDFRNPINQSEVTTYKDKGTPVYTIDMWRIAGGAGRTVTVNDGYISLYNNSTTYDGYWVQPLEFTLPEDDYTVTVNVKHIDSTARVHFGGQLFDLVEGINVFTVHAEITDVTIAFGLNGTTELYWIKLEQGTVSTPLVPRQYAEELMLCQRYYYRYKVCDNVAYVGGTGIVYIAIPQLLNMRKARSIIPTFGSITLVSEGTTIQLAVNRIMLAYDCEVAIDCNITESKYKAVGIEIPEGYHIVIDGRIY